MKHIWAVLPAVSVLLVFLAGCRDRTAEKPLSSFAPEVTGFTTVTEEPSFHLTDSNSDYRYSCIQFLYSFAETDNSYVGIDRHDPLLRFCDKYYGISDVLCGKPECAHTDRTCSGWIGEQSMGLCFNGGKLYWLGNDRDAGGAAGSRSVYGLWKMDPDGTNRELVEWEGVWRFKSGRTIDRMILHRGYVYFSSFKDVIDNGTPITVYSVHRSALNDLKEYDELISVPSTPNSTMWFCCVENKLYFNLCTEIMDQEHGALYCDKAYSYDLDSDSVEVIIDVDDKLFNFYDAMYFEGSLYFSGREGTRACVFTAKDGALEKCFEFVDGETEYSGTILSSGLACAFHRFENDGYEMWVKRLPDGGTVYKGKWNHSLIEEYPDAVFWGVNKVGGDENTLVLHMEFAAGREFVYCFVKYSFDESGLKETVLFFGKE